MNFRFNIFYNYFQILNQAIIRKNEFHFILSTIDTIIILLKILSIYNSSYNNQMRKAIKVIRPSLYLKEFSIIVKLLPVIIYLIIAYLIIFSSLSSDINKKINKFEMAIINIFELFIIRIFFIFFAEFLFGLPSLYLLLFLVLSIPFILFILIDMTFFHLGQFMLSSISFPFDGFTSICDREKIIIKIFVSIGAIVENVYVCKFVYFLQFILLIFFFGYDTYLVFYKSYYLMNNETYTKSRYSNLVSLVIIQILIFFMKPEEIFQKSFIAICIFIYIFITILILVSYDPYNYIIIDRSENKENLFFYFFLVDRNKNVSFYLTEKINDHITICNACSLCKKYQEFIEKNNMIELIDEKYNKSEYKNENENESDNNYDNDKTYYGILYSGKDKSMILFNKLINNIKKLGNSCLNNNSYYTIKLTYIYYYSLRFGDITFSLNMLLLFNLIQENNQSLISTDKIAINQILHINEFLIIYKDILAIIKEIISKNIIKRYLDKFFVLSKKLTILNSSKFKDNLFVSKSEGSSSYSFLLNICSLLYEEIFNKSISNHAIPIRENQQLIEDIIKNFDKQNNHIILNFNLKTMECKVLNAGLKLVNYINKNFYDLFPNQFKEKLIQMFSHVILYPKEKATQINVNKNYKQKAKQFIETTLIIKNTEYNINFLWILELKLFLLFNNCIKENIILNGYFIIHKNTLMTIKNSNDKEKICGFGTEDIMNIAYKKKLNYSRFLESDFMKNKLIKEDFKISVNDCEFCMYNITENKIKKKKNLAKENLSKQYTNFKESGKFTIKSHKKEQYLKLKDDKANKSLVSGSLEQEEESSNIDSIDNSQRVRNIIEDNASQSSALTKTSLSSFWNINKPQARDNQNNFTSKKFLKLQLLLGALLVILLILMIILITNLKIMQDEISSDCNNYLDLIQFIRVFQQFSVQFFLVVCVAMTEDRICKTYISELDTEEFNQTLFASVQNQKLAELGSESINKLISNSESVHDEELIALLKGNITYNLLSKKLVNNIYNISNSLINITLNDALLLLSNNMRIIVSDESKSKERASEPIYLLAGKDNPFLNIHDLTEDLSDYQIAVYTYILNFKNFSIRFSNLNQRFHELINIRNNKLLNLVYILHNIIFVIMIFQVITILFYLYTYNSIIAEIINSVIAKFDVVFDNENDFKKLYTNKINLLEALVNEKSNNLGNAINKLNKNCLKYENLVGANKKNEQRLNMNKKYDKDEEKPIVFKDNQKYVNWVDIYNKGFNKFYIIFVIIIGIIDITVYGIIFGIWREFESSSGLTLGLIYDSWNFERNTLRLINFYHHMIFMNQTLEEISNDFYGDNDYNCIENFLMVLNSYYELRPKKRKTNIFKSFNDYCEFSCQSLYDFMMTIDNNSWMTAIITISENSGKSIDSLKQNFIDKCEEGKTFIYEGVTPSFQSFYQRCINAMISINNNARTYDNLIQTLFNGNLAFVSSVFLNVTRYILHIIGKVSYTGSFDKIIEILENTIIISLVLYIVSEFLLFIFFFFVYIWNINIECKNIFILKKVFEVTNSNDA